MTASSEQRLEEALRDVAFTVTASPGAYREVRSRWRRKERRRRLIVAALATAVVLATNGIALWALNDASPDQHIIFTDPTHAR
ncbi:hypothetical protein G7043_37895 [Lentzea sp. NEAU-D13]|uniref:Uncharacterized protein n=1 Tax=Lentzea alba TaxID=2714351 RepID=A0A7C9W317_9PSEU|nr:hypothetical protein [Lentzea alba]NGY64701.1 hypothetical protein [Lentzea alba]